MPPRKLDPDLAERLFEARRAGKSYAACAELAGVSVSSLHGWVARGNSGVDTTYKAFSDGFAQAYRYFQREQIKAINAHGSYSSRSHSEMQKV